MKRKVRLVRKKCRKCGGTARYRPAVRRCRLQRFGPRSYWCYGQLDAVHKKPKHDSGIAIPPGKGIGWVLSEEAMEQAATARSARVRAEAQKKLDATNDRIVDKQREVARLTRSIAELTRKAAHYRKRAAVTDAELETERQKRVQQVERRAARTPKRRGIRLPGGAR
jgi:hypothetical protein